MRPTDGSIGSLDCEQIFQGVLDHHILKAREDGFPNLNWLLTELKARREADARDVAALRLIARSVLHVDSSLGSSEAEMLPLDWGLLGAYRGAQQAYEHRNDPPAPSAEDIATAETVAASGILWDPTRNIQKLAEILRDRRLHR